MFCFSIPIFISPWLDGQCPRLHSCHLIVQATDEMKVRRYSMIFAVETLHGFSVTILFLHKPKQDSLAPTLFLF